MGRTPKGSKATTSATTAVNTGLNIARLKFRCTRTAVDVLYSEARDLLEQDGDEDHNQHEALTVCHINLIKQVSGLENFNDGIMSVLGEDEEIEAEVTKNMEYISKVNTRVGQLEARLSLMVKRDFSDHSHGEKAVPRQSLIKLPQLNIPKFNGEPLKWQEFWDSYCSAIHSIGTMADVDKFNHLKSLLVGDAAQAIAGISITNRNYNVAIGIIQERFGNEQVVVFAHFEELFSMTKAQENNVKSVRHIYDTVEKHINSLEALEISEDSFGIVLIPLILTKLTQDVKIEINRKRGSQKWTLEILRLLLKEEIQAREVSGQIQIDRPNRRPNDYSVRYQGAASDSTRYHGSDSARYQGSQRRTAEALVQHDGQNEKPRSFVKKCIFCLDTNHFSDECNIYADLPARRAKLRDRCFVCLRSGHNASECPNRIPCFYCTNTTHHRSLCQKRFQNFSSQFTVLSSQDARVEAAGETSNASPLHSSVTSMLSHGESVLMQTALVSIKDLSGTNSMMARILLDTGSQRSFVTQEVVRNLQLQQEYSETLSVSAFGTEKSKVIDSEVVKLCIHTAESSTETIHVNVVSKISNPVTKTPLNKEKYPILADLKLADSVSDVTENVNIDILLGSDYYYDFVDGKIISLDKGLFIIHSKFGWIPTGRMGNGERDPEVSTMLVLNEMERFWSLEEIGIKDNYSVLDDDVALQKFNDSVRFDAGRYQVTFPWKEESPELSEDFELAVGRLRTTVAKMQKSPDLMEKYDNIIQDQLKLGIIEEVQKDQVDGSIVHYIPHHSVVSPNRVTTKVRIVYDASAKSRKTNKSLNESMFRGPVMLQDLCGILLRFRLYPIAIISDLEKAFLQVGIQVQERDVTRFLWLKDWRQPMSSGNMCILRFCRVPFGMVCSPFLLAATIKHHLSVTDKELAGDILQNLYVDNVLCGRDSLQEATEFYGKAKQLFRDANMNLREWVSNSKEFMESVPEVDRADTGSVKVLGLHWDLNDDTISLPKAKVNDVTIWTKREILKTISTVFDPLGYASPVTVRAKILTQELWKQKLDWDDEIKSESSLFTWNEILQDLKDIHLVKLRRYFDFTVQEDAELHCFCDASKRAFGASVYLKFWVNGESRVILFMSKTRLSPIKEMTIPRLELMGVIVATRLIKFVSQELSFLTFKNFVWCDSKCVLYWILGSKLLPRFVENRLIEIRSLEKVVFRYVPTTENPADFLTRGMSLRELLEASMWWHGPSWLLAESRFWPETINLKEQEDGSGERTIPSEQISVLDTGAAEVKPCPYELRAEDFSSFKRLIRVTAWVSRFLNNLRKVSVKRSSVLLAEELEIARNLWIGYVQKSAFATLFQDIRTSSANNMVRQLRLYIDDQGFIRCDGRLGNALLCEEAKCPLLLPRDNYVVFLLVDEFHISLGHSGVSHTLARMRLQYWVQNGRRQIKKVLHRCLICRREDGKPCQVPDAPPLPSARVLKSAPFGHTGVDYFGPLFVRGSGDIQKVWICLFTCAVTRAVHLEIVQGLSCEEFILCLRRFIAKRGKPVEMISDNMRTFTAANTCLKSVLQRNEVQEFVGSQMIIWKFITSYAPWMGGFYERLVGVVKRCLRKTLGVRLLKLDQLETAICEISAIVNSRPLVYVADEHAETLTPAHFLGSKNILLIPESLHAATDLIQGWKKGEELLRQFWDVWQGQYLLSLRERDTKLNGSSSNGRNRPQIGKVVLIGDKGTKRCHWRLGIIKRVINSGDGKVRSVTLSLPNKRTVDRPIKLIYPLEM